MEYMDENPATEMMPMDLMPPPPGPTGVFQVQEYGMRKMVRCTEWGERFRIANEMKMNIDQMKRDKDQAALQAKLKAEQEERDAKHQKEMEEFERDRQRRMNPTEEDKKAMEAEMLAKNKEKIDSWYEKGENIDSDMRSKTRQEEWVADVLDKFKEERDDFNKRQWFYEDDMDKGIFPTHDQIVNRLGTLKCQAGHELIKGDATKADLPCVTCAAVVGQVAETSGLTWSHCPECKGDVVVCGPCAKFVFCPNRHILTPNPDLCAPEGAKKTPKRYACVGCRRLSGEPRTGSTADKAGTMEMGIPSCCPTCDFVLCAQCVYSLSHVAVKIREFERVMDAQDSVFTVPIPRPGGKRHPWAKNATYQEEGFEGKFSSSCGCCPEHWKNTRKGTQYPVGFRKKPKFCLESRIDTCTNYWECEGCRIKFKYDIPTDDFDNSYSKPERLYTTKMMAYKCTPRDHDGAIRSGHVYCEKCVFQSVPCDCGGIREVDTMNHYGRCDFCHQKDHDVKVFSRSLCCSKIEADDVAGGSRLHGTRKMCYRCNVKCIVYGCNSTPRFGQLGMDRNTITPIRHHNIGERDEKKLDFSGYFQVIWEYDKPAADMSGVLLGVARKGLKDAFGSGFTKMWLDLHKSGNDLGIKPREDSHFSDRKFLSLNSHLNFIITTPTAQTHKDANPATDIYIDDTSGMKYNSVSKKLLIRTESPQQKEFVLSCLLQVKRTIEDDKCTCAVNPPQYFPATNYFWDPEWPRQRPNTGKPLLAPYAAPNGQALEDYAETLKKPIPEPKGLPKPPSRDQRDAAWSDDKVDKKSLTCEGCKTSGSTVWQNKTLRNGDNGWYCRQCWDKYCDELEEQRASELKKSNYKSRWWVGNSEPAANERPESEPWMTGAAAAPPSQPPPTPQEVKPEPPIPSTTTTATTTTSSTEVVDRSAPSTQAEIVVMDPPTGSTDTRNASDEREQQPSSVETSAAAVAPSPQEVSEDSAPRRQEEEEAVPKDVEVVQETTPSTAAASSQGPAAEPAPREVDATTTNPEQQPSDSQQEKSPAPTPSTTAPPPATNDQSTSSTTPGQQPQLQHQHQDPSRDLSKNNTTTSTTSPNTQTSTTTTTTSSSSEPPKPLPPVGTSAAVGANGEDGFTAEKYSVGRLGFMSNWKTRYFTVTYGSLTYHASKGGQVCGNVSLSDPCHVRRCERAKDFHPQANKPACDLVIEFREQGKDRKLLIRFRTPSERDQWASSIESSIKK